MDMQLNEEQVLKISLLKRIYCDMSTETNVATQRPVDNGSAPFSLRSVPRPYNQTRQVDSVRLKILSLLHYITVWCPHGTW
jgi:hypothetical protein